MRSGNPYTQLADSELITECLGGERLAWAALIHRYESLIYSIPVRYGLEEPDRSDVFQTTCTRLLEKLSTLRNRDRLASWLISTASRICWEVRRKRSLRENAVREGMCRPPRGPRLPPEEAQAIEERALVRVALDRLSPRCRHLIELLFSSHPPPSYREIALKLGIPEGSVGPTRSRCLEKLRLNLRDLGIDA